MEIKISNKVEQPLLSRIELQGMVSFESATPSRAEVREKIADSIKVDEALITVAIINTDFGQKSAKITAHVYKTKEDLGTYASKTSKSRNTPKGEKSEEKKEKAGKAPAAPAEKKDKGQKTGKTEEKGAKAASDKPKEQPKKEEKKPGAE